MKTADLRSRFLTFFEKRGHKIMPSDTLVPANDPSVLFTPAGMNPFKDHFLGRAKLAHAQQRATSCQKCLRTGDIDNVGVTPRHCTFFEMLGNFSFGDYFKHDAIIWAWEFVTKELAIPESTLWVSVYETDDEAYRIWADEIGIDPTRIARFGEDDNFWPAGAPTHGPDGPCGPCSEIFYLADPDVTLTGDPAVDYDNMVEIWNLVFTQFNRNGLKEDGSPNLEPLPRQNIDTGMGTERVAALLQGKRTVFDADLLFPVVSAAAAMCGKTYPNDDPSVNASLRKIADHIRAGVFAIADACPPSNVGAGYVIRKLLRRAVMNAIKLGIDEPRLFELSEVIGDGMGNVYPAIIDNAQMIRDVILEEETQFRKTLHSAGRRFQTYVEGLDATGGGQPVVTGKAAFDFYETYGLPIDAQQQLADDLGARVDAQAFAAVFKESREKNKEKKDVFAAGPIGDIKRRLADTPPEFIGYDGESTDDARVLAIIKDDMDADEVRAGDTALIVIDPIPFYAEQGGQVGDTGVIVNDSGRARVVNTTQDGYLPMVSVTVESGTITRGDRVHAAVDTTRRAAIRRHHTATHLLHAALRRRIGDHVHQRGSYVADDRLRFDFQASHALSADQIADVERLVNEMIRDNAPVIVEELPIDEAKKMGAMALFNEKYGDVVRVVKCGESVELCGGTHVSRAGDIGALRVVSESSIAAGIRRIEAIAGEPAITAMRADANLIDQLNGILKVQPADLADRVIALSHEKSALEKEVKKLKSELAAAASADLLSDAVNAGGVTLLLKDLGTINGSDLKSMGEALIKKLSSGVIVLAGADKGKAGVVVAATQDIVKRGFSAGKVIKILAKKVSGGGGGRPDFAQAGGKNPGGIPELIATATDVIQSALN